MRGAKMKFKTKLEHILRWIKNRILAIKLVRFTDTRRVIFLSDTTLDSTTLEQHIDRHAEYCSVDARVRNMLNKKREDGNAKYGDKAYQASRKNFMSIDFRQHGKEEILDAINYLLLEQVQLSAHRSRPDRKNLRRMKKSVKLLKKVLDINRL
jgi:hypothetical protein